MKELSRELRHAEKNSNLTNISPVYTMSTPAAIVPDKDRDSTKRVRRKPKGRADFVDINEALSNFAAEEVCVLLHSILVLCILIEITFLFLGSIVHESRRYDTGIPTS